jgi:hypothetical protein
MNQASNELTLIIEVYSVNSNRVLSANGSGSHLAYISIQSKAFIDEIPDQSTPICMCGGVFWPIPGIGNQYDPDLPKANSLNPTLIENQSKSHANGGQVEHLNLRLSS